MNLFQYIGSLLFGKQQTKQTVSSEMQTAIETWLSLYTGHGSALKLPSSVASELARLVLAESEIKVSSASLDEYMQQFWEHFCVQAECAFALGSMAFKPYISGDKIVVDLVRADRYVPTAFDSAGETTAAIFMERKKNGGRYYTRLEAHTFDGGAHTHTVENKAYCSLSESHLGAECSLSDVDGWEQLQPVQTIANVQKPLFAVFKMPTANHTDLDSPLGVSVYADAVSLFKQAEQQWERLMWEFEGTELAVDAASDLFRYREGKGLSIKLPHAVRRLFRRHEVRPDVKLSDMIQVFSPTIRDSNIYNGFNRILQRIEFACGLAYGVLSDPQAVEKTAEEIRASKQRSYVQTSRTQRSLESALTQLLDAMKVYASLYDLQSDGDAELTCSWGDSVLEDSEKTFQRRFQMAQAGYLKPELVVSYEFGCSEEEAQKMMPNDGMTLFGGGTSAIT